MTATGRELDDHLELEPLELRCPARVDQDRARPSRVTSHSRSLGYHGDHPPREAQNLLAWAQQLEIPDIARSLAAPSARPLGPVHSFRAPAQVRRRWDRCRLPEGLAIFGDAPCTLDPTFGQGMSVAAMQALALARQLRRGPFRSRRAQRAVNAMTKQAWLITSVEVARYDESAPEVRVPGVRLLQRFLDQVYAASTTDLAVHQAFLDVAFLNRGPAWLMRPAILLRLVRAWLSRVPRWQLSRRARQA